MIKKPNKYIVLGLVLLICYLGVQLLGSSNTIPLQTRNTADTSHSHADLIARPLPFVPTNMTNFTCDDLFTGSQLDHFNFSEGYYKCLPEYQDFLKKWPFSGDGHSAMFPTQFKVLHFFSTQKIYHSYCETGFNYGHSSFSALTGQNHSKVLSFDIGYHDYTKKIMPYFQQKFKNRFTPVLGDSSVSLPKFISKNPSYRCDNFFVDGSHSYNIGLKDLQSFAKMAEENNIVVFDDYPTIASQFDNQLGKAWNQAIKEGWLVEFMKCKRKTDKIRGFCIGSFVKKS